MDRHERPLNIGVLGGDVSPADAALAYEVGAGLARAGAILLCGGHGGVMQAAAAGAKSQGGLTVGILPGISADAANPFIDVALPTGLGPVRNALIARAAHAVIAICGGFGTLSEIAFALRLGVPVIGLKTWTLHAPPGGPVAERAAAPDEPLFAAESPAEAVAVALARAAAFRRRVLGG